LTFTLCINAPFFLRWIEWDGNEYRLSGISTGWTWTWIRDSDWGITKNLPSLFFIFVHSLFHCRFCSHGTAKHH
jgi:hypothetical protein